MFDTPIRSTNRGSRAMTPQELEEFLTGSLRYGTLAFTGEGGWPDIRPLNFGYWKGAFYFHANRNRGEKLKYLCNQEPVCINIFEPSDQIGQSQLCTHRSVLAYGNIQRIDGNPELESEAWAGMTEMCRAAGTPYKADPERLKKTIHGISIFRVVPQYIVGKIVVFTSLPSPPTLRMEWK